MPEGTQTLQISEHPNICTTVVGAGLCSAPTSHIRFSAVFRVEQARRAKWGAARAAPRLRHVALSAAAAGVAAAGIAAAVIAGAEDQQKDDDPPPAVAEGAESGLITRHNKTS